MRGRGALIGAMAAAGVVATHVLTFLVAAPSGHHRSELLARTGHVRFTLVAAAAMGLLVTAAVRFLPLRRPFAQLLVVQSLGWLALESVERLSHHGADWELGVIALGLVVQAVVALAGGALLGAVRRVIAFVARRRRPRFASVRTSARPVVATLSLRPAVLAGAAGVRGPPYSP